MTTQDWLGISSPYPVDSEDFAARQRFISLFGRPFDSVFG